MFNILFTQKIHDSIKKKSFQSSLIGAYGPEKSQKIAETKPEGKEQDSKDAERISQWRKGEGSKKKKARYIYKSIEDVLDQSVQPGKSREFR